MKNKWIILLALIMVFTMLATACSKSTAQETTAKPAETTVATTEATTAAVAPTVLKVGLDDTYKPMEFIDENDKLTGFDIDMANALSKEIGMEIEFISSEWDGIFLALDSGKFDAIISSVSMTLERTNKMEFTKPYLANGQLIVTNPADADKVNTKEDLKDMAVGVQMGTTSDTALTKFVEENPDFNIEVSRYDDINQTFADLKTGRLNGIVVDGMVAIDYAKNDPASFKVSSVNLSNEPIAIAVKKGNLELTQKLQAGLDTIKANGTLAEISVKWFGADYTSNIDETLN